MANDTWTSTVSGNWNVAADWSSGVPGTSSAVYIATSGPQVITINSNVGQIGSIYYIASNDTLSVASGAFLQVLGEVDDVGPLIMSGGQLEFSGDYAQFSGQLAITGGTLTADIGLLEFGGTSNSIAGATLNGGGTVDFYSGTDAVAATTTLSSGGLLFNGAAVSFAQVNRSYAGNWTQNNGTVSLNGGTYTLTGMADFNGGIVNTAGEFILSGADQIGNAFELGGTTTIDNTGSLTDNGSYFNLGSSSSDATRLINAATGTLSLVGPNTIYVQGNSTLVNAGLLQVSAGALGTTTIQPVLTETGTISILSGTLVLSATGDTIGGSVTGAGTLESTGTSTILAGASLSEAGFINTNYLALNESLTYAGNFVQTGNTLTLGANTLTLSGTATLAGLITGSGSVSLTGTSEVGSFYIGATGTLLNKGLVEQVNYAYVGNNSTDTARLVNSGSWLIQGDQTIYDQGSGTITNTGTLSKAAGDGTSTIQPSLVNTGVLVTASGTLSLSGTADSLGGTLGGNGELNLAGGTDTLVSGVAVVVAGLELTGANVTLGGNLNYVGNFLQTAGTLNIASKTLVFYNNAIFNGGSSFGSGVIATVGQTEIGAYVFGGTMTYSNNAGTLTQNNYLYIGGSGSDAATAINQYGATWNVVGDVSIYDQGSSTLDNDGTFAKTGGSGTTGIGTVFNNAASGTLVVDSGTVQLSGSTASIGGVVSGAGALDLSAGNDTLASGVSLLVANLDLTGAAVTLAGNTAYDGSFLQTTNSFNIGSNTLTLLNIAVLNGGDVTGSGAVTASGQTEIGGYYFEGSVTFNNAGTVTQNNYLSIGGSASDTATVVNEAGATWNVVGDANFYDQGSGTLDNAGTLAKTGGSGVTSIQSAFVNTGVLVASFGTIQIDGITASLGGIIGGNSVIQLSGGSDTLDAGLQLVAATTRLSGANVTLNANLTYQGSFYADSGTLDLNGNVLVLYNTDEFDGGVANGGGAIATTGNTHIGGYQIGQTTEFSNNSGTVDETGLLYDGASSGDATSAINQAGAVWLLDGDNAEIYAEGSASFINAGLIVKTGSATSYSYIDPTFTNVGTIQIQSGDLQLNGSANQIGGTISGGGELSITGGSDTLTAGLSLTVASLYTASSTIDLTGNLTYAGALYANGVINTGSATLTLTGNDVITNNITGTGSVVTTGTTTIGGGEAIEGNVGLTNSGLLQVVNGSYFYIGYQQIDSTQITNTAAGTIALHDNASIDANSNGTISSAGTILKADGTGTSTIQAALVNTGTVSVASGQLNLTGAMTGTGSYNVSNGAVLYQDASVGAGATVNLATTSELVLGAATTFAGTIAGFAHGDLIELQGFTYGSASTTFNATTDVLTVIQNTSTAAIHFSGTGLSQSSFLFSQGFNGLAIGHA